MADKRLVVPARFSRSVVVDEERARDSARWQIDFVCERLGVDDLSATEVLDMGCGVKMTTAFINEGIPIRRYVGIDVYGEMIDFLDENVDDPRFTYHHLDLHNDLYNPNGQPLTPTTELPVEPGSFDLIWLFSVFTHLNPTDYRSLLMALRPYVRPTGKLFFSLYVNAETEGGHGFIDSMARLVRERPELSDRRRTSPPDGESVPPFIDVSPTHPLRTAVYSEAYARELISGTGWEPVALFDPGLYVQHSFLCTAV